MFKDEYKKFMNEQNPGEEAVEFAKFNVQEGENAKPAHRKSRVFSPAKGLVAAAACLALIVAVIPMIAQYNSTKIGMEDSRNSAVADDFEQVQEFFRGMRQSSALELGDVYFLQTYRAFANESFETPAPENDMPAEGGVDVESSRWGYDDMQYNRNILRPAGYFIYELTDDFVSIIRITGDAPPAIMTIPTMRQQAGPAAAAPGFNVYVTSDGAYFRLIGPGSAGE